VQKALKPEPPRPGSLEGSVESRAVAPEVGVAAVAATSLLPEAAGDVAAACDGGAPIGLLGSSDVDMFEAAASIVSPLESTLGKQKRTRRIGFCL
jgi:hypothetical protein